MNTYRNDKYTFTISLNERTVHIKLVNNVSYMCYEGNFDATAFKLSFDIADTYELVKECIICFVKDNVEEDSDKNKNNNYDLTITLDNSILLLKFQCVVGGFLNVAFDLRLREKLMSNDAQLTIDFQRIEQKHREAIDSMTKRMNRMETILEALGNAEICFTRPPSNQIYDIVSYPITTKILSINAQTNAANEIHVDSFKKIKYFYQLEELTLNNCHWYDPHIHTSNSTVKKLTLSACPPFGSSTFIKNFPNLQELIMIGASVDSQFVTTLRSIPHKIKNLDFTSVTSLNQTEMQTYCTQNNIKLSIK